GDICACFRTADGSAFGAVTGCPPRDFAGAAMRKDAPDDFAASASATPKPPVALKAEALMLAVPASALLVSAAFTTRVFLAARAFSSSALALASLSRVRDTASSTWAFTFWKAANSARSDIENLRINGWSLRKSST
ncbi:MAG: hypothetical protein ACLUHG_05820, partial [Sutterella wadsworthensis]